MLGITPLNCNSRGLWKLGIQLSDLLRSCDAVFNNEVDHVEKMLPHLGSVVQVDLAWVNCIVSHYAAEIEGLLDLDRQTLSNKRFDV